MEHEDGARARSRGPFTRWPRAADAVLAAVVLLLTVYVVDGPGDTMLLRPLGDVPLISLAAFVVAGVALAWRRRQPLVVLAVVLGAWALTLGGNQPVDVGGVALVALYSVGRYGPDGRWRHLGVDAAVALCVVDGFTGPGTWGETGLAAAAMFIAWYLGRRLRLRAQRASQRAREQAAEARRIVTEERTRIARELHDVVAHRVSLMTVQAGAAKAVAARDPEAARQAMGAVEEAGRQALEELRHLLGVLRPEVEPDGLGPQPGITDLPRLAAEVREAGLDLTVTMDGIRGPLPARVELSAYRIVQEALTNVIKHGGPGARTEVRLHGDAGGITVEVLDDGGGPAAPGGDEHAGGHGIVGMRERARLLGGTLDAGPCEGGGFRVVARLPVAGEAA